MNPYIVAAVPAFLLLIGLEAWISHRKGLKLYRFSDSIADLGTGMIHQVTDWAIALFGVLVYQALFERFAAVAWPAGWVWLVGFIGVDFCYYWMHRLSHEVGFMWAAHVVHHQSEEYNLSVALRQSSLQPLFKWLFYWPLAVLGVPLLVFLPFAALNRLYQFWLHTRLIKRLGPLEWLFNTPSHHRVHHGQNAEYIDRNHGGTLIIWDRFFKTFEPERAEVVYGVTEPTRSWNPLWANFDVWAAMVRRARRVSRWSDKVKLFIKGPGWRPEGWPEDKPAWPSPKYDPQVTASVRTYVAGQFIGVLVLTLSALAVSQGSHLALKLGLCATVIVSLTTLGSVLDGRGWAVRFERVRSGLVALGVGGLAISAWPFAALMALGGWAVISTGWWFKIARQALGSCESPPPPVPTHLTPQTQCEDGVDGAV